jgi:hypothetical protein
MWSFESQLTFRRDMSLPSSGFKSKPVLASQCMLLYLLCCMVNVFDYLLHLSVKDITKRWNVSKLQGVRGQKIELFLLLTSLQTNSSIFFYPEDGGDIFLRNVNLFHWATWRCVLEDGTLIFI